MKQYVKQWQIPSDSNPNTTYTVSLTPEQTFECSCPAWTRNTPRVDCKHIRRLQRDNFVTPAQAMAKVIAPASQSAAPVKAVPVKAQISTQAIPKAPTVTAKPAVTEAWPTARAAYREAGSMCRCPVCHATVKLLVTRLGDEVYAPHNGCSLSGCAVA